jgi:uncharacterized protein (TIGR00255 family)
MTGFGRATHEDEHDSFEVEVRSVNNRHLSVKTRLPPLLSRFEKDIEERLRKSASRGSFDVYVKWRTRSRHHTANFDFELADQYVRSLREFASRHRLDDSISASVVLALPGVLQTDEDLEVSDTHLAKLLRCLDEAIRQLLEMRRSEGARLDRELKKRVQSLRRFAARVKKRHPRVVIEHEKKLRERLAVLLNGSALSPSDDGLRREVAMLADRSDIAEELARFESHLEQFEAFLSKGEAVGRSLDFLLQEMGREINTMGSKSQDVEIARLVVDLKSELERVREQVQNLE